MRIKLDELIRQLQEQQKNNRNKEVKFVAFDDVSDIEADFIGIDNTHPGFITIRLEA